MPLDTVKALFGLVSASAGCVVICALPFVLTRWPYVATTVHALQDLKTILQPFARPDLSFVDLGSGDGSVLQVACAAGFGTCIGVEKNPILSLYSRWRVRNLPNARVLWCPFERYSITEADLVYVYGGENLMPALATKFIDELKPGATIVCNTFPLPLRHTNTGNVRLGLAKKYKTFYIYRAFGLTS